MNQFRQNTLLVATIRNNNSKIEVASELKCFHPGVRMQEALRLLLSEYIVVNKQKERLSEEKVLAVNLLYAKYQNLVDLKMIKLYQLQQVALDTLIKEINSGHIGLTNKCFLQSLEGTLLFVNEFEYFGKLKGKVQHFIIKMHLRPKRKHFTKYIGVGYKDKGTAKEESWDGFHSWQEITATGESRLNERIRANNVKFLKGSKVESLREFKSIELEKDNFGNPIRGHLEKILIDNQYIAWREYKSSPSVSQLLLVHMLAPIRKKFKKKYVPARDREGSIIFIEDTKKSRIP